MSNHININETLITYVDPFPGLADDAEVFITCGRCGGRGHMSEYSTTYEGVCFECLGSKGHKSTAGQERKREKSRVYRVNRKERELIKSQQFHNAQMEAAEAKFPVLAGWFDAMAEGDAFLSDLWSKAFKYELSEKQVAAAAASLTRKAERQAARQAEKDAAAPAPVGKVEVTGEVVTVKFQDSQYGGQWKMVVKGEGGFKVWATIPSKLIDTVMAEQGELDADSWTGWSDLLKGRQVKFTATLEASQDDASFAFAKRPTKASLVK